MISLNNFGKIKVTTLSGYALKYFGPMSHLKLQKLLFYCQAYHLAKFNDTLFDEDFEAWVHGPVCREVYNVLKGKSVLHSDVSYDESDFDSDVILAENVASEQYGLINEVLSELSKWSGSELETSTHNEQPWIEARKGHTPNQNCSTIISKDSMRNFYKAEMDGWV